MKNLGFIHVSMGGPEYDIQVNGVVYHFEWHPYCGPIRLNKKGEEHKAQPKRFLHAASLWAQQGRKVEDGRCVWHHEPKPILRHLGGRNYEVIGHHPAERGK